MSRSPSRIDNEYIANILIKLSEIYTKSEYGKQAIIIAANKIKNMPIKITKVSQLKNIRGIGPGIKDRVEEILKTGKLRELSERSVKEEDKEIQELTSILFIGKVKAKKLIKKGIKTIKDLKKYEKKAELTSNQSMSLEYHNDINKKLSYSEVARVGYCIINSVIKEIDKDNIAIIVGSHRRSKDYSSDVDILLTNKKNKNTLGKIVKILKDSNFLIHVFSLGKVKFQGIFNMNFLCDNPIGRKIDIRFIEYENFGVSLQHFTGPDTYNIELRKRALSKGYTLSEHGLYKLSNNKQVVTRTEAELYNILELDYKEPEERY